MRTCCLNDESFGNLFEASFEEIWNGDAFVRFRDQHRSEQLRSRLHAELTAELTAALAAKPVFPCPLNTIFTYKIARTVFRIFPAF